MKSLYLKLETPGLNSVGFNIEWENENLHFVVYESLGIFDDTNCALVDNEQGALVIAAFNTDDREIKTIENPVEFLKIDFEWINNVEPETVKFLTSGISGQDAANDAVTVQIITTDYVPKQATIIEFVWR